MTSGSVTSTKQFVWSNDAKREQRNGAGAVERIFLSHGQINSTSNYFYSKDHCDSVRQLTNNSGTLESIYQFDPYGRVASSENVRSDFQFGSYYSHERSSLNLTLFRQYNSLIGRWVSRDPILISNIPFRLLEPVVNEPSVKGFAGNRYIVPVSKFPHAKEVPQQSARTSTNGTLGERHGSLYCYLHNMPIYGNDPRGLNPMKCSILWASVYAACMVTSGGDHELCKLTADCAEQACLWDESRPKPKKCPDDDEPPCDDDWEWPL